MKIGFIGAGNMASAIISGLIQAKFVAAEDIGVFDVSQKQMQTVSERYGVIAAASQDALIQQCEFIVLAVKPVIHE